MGAIKNHLEEKADQVIDILGWSWDHYSFVFDFVMDAPQVMTAREVVFHMAESFDN